jgi:hypothetical protein
MHDFQPCTATVWDCLCYWVTKLTLHKSLADVTMVTKACNLLYGKNDKCSDVTMATSARCLLYSINDLKAWLDLGVKDLYRYLLNRLVDFHEIW